MPQVPQPLTSKSEPGPVSRVLRLRFDAIKDLHNCYMPFIRGGGLFVSGDLAYQPGDRVLLLLRLPRATSPEAVAAQASWITPANAQTGLKQGTGFRFIDPDHPEDSGLRKQIEALLSQELREPGRGHTL